MLGTFGGKEAREGVQCGQAGIARGNAVAAPRLKVSQEAHRTFTIEIGDVETLDWAIGIGRRKAQEQHKGITVALDRVRAQTAQMGQILFEEAAYQAARQVYDYPSNCSCTKWPHRCAKRSLASAASVGTRGR